MFRSKNPVHLCLEPDSFLPCWNITNQHHGYLHLKQPVHITAESQHYAGQFTHIIGSSLRATILCFTSYSSTTQVDFWVKVPYSSLRLDTRLQCLCRRFGNWLYFITWRKPRSRTLAHMPPQFIQQSHPEDHRQVAHQMPSHDTRTQNLNRRRSSASIGGRASRTSLEVKHVAALQSFITSSEPPREASPDTLSSIPLIIYTPPATPELAHIRYASLTSSVA